MCCSRCVDATKHFPSKVLCVTLVLIADHGILTLRDRCSSSTSFKEWLILCFSGTSLLLERKDTLHYYIIISNPWSLSNDANTSILCKQG